VRSAIYDAMRFWFSRGIDGFRVDAVWYAIKDEDFRDNPANPRYTPASPPDLALLPLYTADRPEMEDVIAEMRRVSDEFPDRLLIGELYLPIERLVAYYGRDLTGVHLPFNFTLLTATWGAEPLAKLIREYYPALPPGGWPNWVLGNHDRPRVATRVGPGQARVAAMLLLTLHGTPTIYCGEEIGMEQAQIPPERVRDPVELNVPGFAWRATVAGRRCSGMPANMPVSQPTIRGSLSGPITKSAMWNTKGWIRLRCFGSTAHSLRFAAAVQRLPRAHSIRFGPKMVS
jgi:alpha-glucosidase